MCTEYQDGLVTNKFRQQSEGVFLSAELAELMESADFISFILTVFRLSVSPFSLSKNFLKWSELAGVISLGTTVC
jgi:hypothetical protein